MTRQLYPSREQNFLAAIAKEKEVPPQRLFEKLEIAGKGAYGAVYRGRHISTSQIVALKIINLDTADDDVADIQKEVGLLQQLMTQAQRDATKAREQEAGGEGAGEGSGLEGHAPYGVPNVIKYYGSWLEGPRVWIVMEYADGGSVRTLSRAQKLTELQIALVCREVLVGLAFLHKNGVIHRDIKAANILITSMPNRVLLCDFGVSAMLPSNASKRTTFIGTPYWMAPEVITTGASYDYKADIWSFGITVLEMANGEPPMSGQDARRAIMLIPKQRAPRLEGGTWSREMREFVTGCLNEEPADRLPASELSQTTFIRQQSKQSLSHLNELLVNMQEWKDRGNVRMSLADGVGAPIFDDDDEGDGQEEEWRFNTVRSRMSMNMDEASDLLGLPALEPPNRPFAHGGPHSASISSTSSSISAPRSLRSLFQSSDDLAGGNQSISSAGIASYSSGGSGLRQPFGFPQQREEPATIRTAEPADGKRGRSQSDDAAGSLGGANPPRTATYRNIRDSKNLAPIVIPSSADFTARAPMEPLSSRSVMVEGNSQQATPRNAGGPVSSSPISSRGKAPWDPATAERGGPSRGDPRRAEALDTAGQPRPTLAFQFPTSRNAPGPQSASTRPSPPSLQRNHSAMPLISSETPSRTPAGLPAPVRPGMLRQASVAVMEGRGASTPASTVQAGAPMLGGGGLVPRMTPLAAAAGPPLAFSSGMSRSRSGSRADETSLTPLVIGAKAGGSNLKDGLQPLPPVSEGDDLLPASPITLTGSFRAFAQGPSPLSAVTITPASKLRPVDPQTESPVSDDGLRTGRSRSSTDPGSSSQESPRASIDGATFGPALRPLDLGRLTTSEDVFAELGRTASDMSKWLGLIVGGLDDMLSVAEGPDAVH